MLRKIIHIDEEVCTGCGLCVSACHEGAIGLVGGKARLMRDDYCDGLGDCLPACPVDAITFVERETVPYDAEAVARAQEDTSATSCPSARAQLFDRQQSSLDIIQTDDSGSELGQWPVQIRLVASHARCLEKADLLVAADCTAFACGDFHTRFMPGRVVLVGCPKLDPVDYTERLSEIMAEHDINSVTVVLMEVPCCAGLGTAVQAAIAASGKEIPCKTVIITTDGQVNQDEER